MKAKDKKLDFERRLERRANQSRADSYGDGKQARFYWWPAWKRLEAARKKASAFETRAGAMVAPGMRDWRMHRERMTLDNGAGRMNDGSGNYYAYKPDTFGDYLGNVPDVMKRAGAYRRHDYATGYYTDDYCSETIGGGVERIRCPKGTLYVPVTSYSDSDITTYWFSDAVLVPKGSDEAAHNDAMREAARYADGKAETEAEEAREHNEAYNKGNEWADAGEELKQARAAFLAIRKDARANGPASPVLCAAITEKLKRLADEWASAKAKRAALVDEWRATWRRELWPAFNDGAGTKVIGD